MYSSVVNMLMNDMTPCSPSSFKRRFEGTYRLHSACHLLACCFLTYFFDPEDGDDMSLRNAG
jgi:hypothetical protein